MKRLKSERIFDFSNTIFLGVIVLLTIYPMWYVAVASISNANAVSCGDVMLWPVGLEFAAYEKVFGMKNIWIAYANTVFYSVAGTFVSMVLTVLGAYPLSKSRLKGRKIITFLVMVTMWFNPGIMPIYLNLRNLNLLDNRITIIIAFAVITFYVILMKTFFESVPEAMEESAKIDGANDWTVLFNIYLPLSVPALATLTMYYFVGRWNSYFWAMLVLTDPNKIPLQVLLKKLVVEMTTNNSDIVNIDITRMSKETIIYATIIIATIPMLALYPFIQKYFVKGIMVGAVKG